MAEQPAWSGFSTLYCLERFLCNRVYIVSMIWIVGLLLSFMCLKDSTVKSYLTMVTRLWYVSHGKRACREYLHARRRLHVLAAGMWA